MRTVRFLCFCCNDIHFSELLQITFEKYIVQCTLFTESSKSNHTRVMTAVVPMEGLIQFRNEGYSWEAPSHQILTDSKNITDNMLQAHSSRLLQSAHFMDHMHGGISYVQSEVRNNRCIQHNWSGFSPSGMNAHGSFRQQFLEEHLLNWHFEREQYVLRLL